MALYSESVVRLLIFAALLLLFTLKARYEEQLLLGKYPGYAAYMTRTGMFLP
jgi:protein-S-isoprenylcysteine O-methyltransferase Ste14